MMVLIQLKEYQKQLIRNCNNELLKMDNEKQLESLKERIVKLKPIAQTQKFRNNKLDAFSISIEIVAGVIVGLMTGILLDRIFTTKPLFLIICLTLGMIASAKVIWQKVKNNNGA